MAYAVRTKVPANRSRSEIEVLLKRYGAKRFAYANDTGHVILVFDMADRRVRFTVPMPDKEQAERARWRAVLLCIKAKLESVAAGIETFEDAFLSHVVMPDGMTVGEHTRPAIASAYKGEPLPPLLPGIKP